MLQFIFLFCFIICPFDVAIDFWFVAAIFFVCYIICSFIISIACFFCCCSWCWTECRGELAMGGLEVLWADEVGGG